MADNPEVTEVEPTPVFTSLPAVPPRVRTVAYFTSLVVGGLATMATGVVAAVAPHLTGQVTGITGAVTAGVALIVGGLGVVYRPTAK